MIPRVDCPLAPYLPIYFFQTLIVTSIASLPSHGHNAPTVHPYLKVAIASLTPSVQNLQILKILLAIPTTRPPTHIHSNLPRVLIRLNRRHESHDDIHLSPASQPVSQHHIQAQGTLSISPQPVFPRLPTMTLRHLLFLSPHLSSHLLVWRSSNAIQAIAV